MSALESKLKTAMDETRLLILGGQVLFGFQFEAVFQELFAEVGRGGRAAHCASLALLLITIGCLIAPASVHQIAYGGESRRGALEAATALAGLSLLPLTLGLGCSAFVIFERMYGRSTALSIGISFTAAGLALLYGLGMYLKRGAKKMPSEERGTPLKTKIEQMLTEARVIIPGGQALLGFQFIATLTKPFSQLPGSVQIVHAVGLCAVALAVLLLMTPAAVHRIAFHGEDDEDFFRIGSILVIAAPLPLAIGIAADIFVVYYKISESMTAAVSAAILALLVLLSVWYGYPLWRRRDDATGPARHPVAGKSSASS
jgi:hypothetical protein